MKLWWRMYGHLLLSMKFFKMLEYKINKWKLRKKQKSWWALSPLPLSAPFSSFRGLSWLLMHLSYRQAPSCSLTGFCSSGTLINGPASVALLAHLVPQFQNSWEVGVKWSTSPRHEIVSLPVVSHPQNQMPSCPSGGCGWGRWCRLASHACPWVERWARADGRTDAPKQVKYSE